MRYLLLLLSVAATLSLCFLDAKDRVPISDKLKSTEDILPTIPDTLFLPPVDMLTYLADSIARAERYLTTNDYAELAQELGIETAAMHAVIDIEAGELHQGFWADGKPVICFSLDLFRKYASKHGVKIDKYRKKHPEVFDKPDRKNYKSYYAAVEARFNGALAIDTVSAIEATYWGMFQIGGFNWKLCGTQSPQEFMSKMSESERSQVELFGALLKKCDMLTLLQKKDWTNFARRYNGPSYASRKYHTRLAKAYKKYSSLSSGN